LTHCGWRLGLALVREPTMFERPHHQRIARVLAALNGSLLRHNHCLFGGGTAIALRYGEYRESVDIDFLMPLDMATTKLLANSDRGLDDGVFNRDLIDLAMMNPPLALLRRAVAKAEQAYGKSIRQDLDKAINRMHDRHGWLERCMQVMAMTVPKAQLWQRIRALKRVQA